MKTKYELLKEHIKEEINHERSPLLKMTLTNLLAFMEGQEQESSPLFECLATLRREAATHQAGEGNSTTLCPVESCHDMRVISDGKATLCANGHLTKDGRVIYLGDSPGKYIFRGLWELALLSRPHEEKEA